MSLSTSPDDKVLPVRSKKPGFKSRLKRPSLPFKPPTKQKNNSKKSKFRPTVNTGSVLTDLFLEVCKRSS